MKRHHAASIRYAILMARHDWCTPLTAEHLIWLEQRDRRRTDWTELEVRAYWQERNRLFQKSIKLINKAGPTA